VDESQRSNDERQRLSVLLSTRRRQTTPTDHVSLHCALTGCNVQMNKPVKSTCS